MTGEWIARVIFRAMEESLEFVDNQYLLDLSLTGQIYLGQSR